MSDSDDIFFFQDAPKPAEPSPDKKQDDVLRHVQYLIDKFPKGFIIITAPDQGTTCQMYKWNPRMYRIFNAIEEFVKKISGWSVGGLN